MNWYKKAKLVKVASVTFWVEGSQDISQPMHKLDICHDLSNFVFYEMKIGQQFGFQWDDFDPDISSGDFDAPTGPINIYLRNPNIKEGIVKNIIDEYNNYKFGSIKLKFIEINKSGVREDVNVARVLIEENNTVESEQLPEMNIANDNSMALIQLLNNEGMSNLDPYGGTINADELKAAISNIESNDFIIDTYTQEPGEVEGGIGKAYDFGRSYEQLKRYINRLKEMINYIEVNNLPIRQINYG
tara:strand:+ start:19701 stop:20432 length:732 start_codon:yes stop_codon:yes gene_type:complete